jgi:hypothetical protein
MNDQEINGQEEKVDSLAIGAPLPWMVDVMMRVEKMRVSSQVRQSHLLRNGEVDAQTNRVWGMLVGIEKMLDKDIATLIEEHPAYHWFSRVKGIGTENIAKVIGLIDITLCPHVSSLWQFAGYGVVNGEAPKRTKGEPLRYCSKLRTMCWRLGGSLMKTKGPYYDYYLAEKAKYESRAIARGQKILPAAQLPKVKGPDGKTRKAESDQAISEGHIHAMALRKMIKLILSHLWLVWREAENLPTSEPYVQDKLGHTHIIGPWDMVKGEENA